MYNLLCQLRNFDHVKKVRIYYACPNGRLIGNVFKRISANSKPNPHFNPNPNRKAQKRFR